LNFYGKYHFAFLSGYGRPRGGISLYFDGLRAVTAVQPVKVSLTLLAPLPSRIHRREEHALFSRVFIFNIYIADDDTHTRGLA